MAKFFLLSDDDPPKLVPGSVGVSTGYIDAPDGVIETDDPWAIAELELMADTAGHPVSRTAPPKPRPSTKE